MAEIIDDGAAQGADNPYLRWSTLITYDRNTGVMPAGETVRLRGEGSRALAERRREIHTARGAAAVVQRQQWEPGPWVDDDGPAVVATRYMFSRLPEAHAEYRHWRITAEYETDSGGWSVRHMDRALFTTGEWLPDRHVPTGIGDDDWWSTCRYPRDRALELACAAVDTVTVNGRTVANMLAGVWPMGPCGNERELPDGGSEVCTEPLFRKLGKVSAICPKCGAWTGVYAPGRPGNPQ